MYNKVEKYSNGDKTLYVLYVGYDISRINRTWIDIFIFDDPNLNKALSGQEYNSIFNHGAYSRDTLNYGPANTTARHYTEYSDQLCLFSMDLECVSIMRRSLLKSGYKPVKKLCKKLHVVL